MTPIIRSMDSPQEPSDRRASFDDIHAMWQEEYNQVLLAEMINEERWLENNPEPIWISDEDQRDMDRESRASDEPLSDHLFDLGVGMMKVQGENIIKG